MEGMIAGRTAGDMPGLDIAEQRSWQNFLDSALRMYASLNRALVEAHQLTLNDVRLLDILDKSPTGSERMGDLAEGLMSLPSRVTRQIRRLEVQGLVRRVASPDDGRGVLASITDEGRQQVREAMVTYGTGVRDTSSASCRGPRSPRWARTADESASASREHRRRRRSAGSDALRRIGRWRGRAALCSRLESERRL